jgi:hypothetical protein
MVQAGQGSHKGMPVLKTRDAEHVGQDGKPNGLLPMAEWAAASIAPSHRRLQNTLATVN